MVFTHVVVGMALAVPIVAVAPEFAGPAALAGALGGLAPDIDLFVGEHRRTFHFPVLLWPPALVACVVAVLAPSATTVPLAVGVLAAAVHSTSDMLGAGEELRPWERTNRNAVYDHARRRWLRARYVVPYDGSRRDLVLTVLFAVPVAAAFQGPPRLLAAAVVLLAVPYAIVRKRLPKYFARIL